MSNIFKCPSNWLDRTINVTLVGAGGNGSNAYDALVQLHHGLLAVGHPKGLSVTLYDMDRVDMPNVGRQRFTYCDIGNNKATTIVNRYNLAYGLDWISKPERFNAESLEHRIPEILITCVDTVSTRSEIGNYISQYDDNESNDMWLDFGNGRTKAQAILGHLINNKDRLPNVCDLYPELGTMEEDNEPSCSLAEAIQSQDLFVNRSIVDAGINILWQLLRNGEIDHHGVFINQSTSEVKPLKINPDVWKFMGYEKSDCSQEMSC